MKKSQSMVEYIVAIILFIVIVIYLLNIYFDRLPEEIVKIEEQELCSEAESMAHSFLDTPGEPSNWEAGGELTRLGFADDYLSNVSYAKWEAAINRSYYNISKSTGLNYTFHLSYFIYALNFTQDNPPQPANKSSPHAFIGRFKGDRINISAGSNNTRAHFNLTLFFQGGPGPLPQAVSILNCSGSAYLETGEYPRTYARDNGVEFIMNWTVADGDEDCISVATSPAPKLVYIIQAIMENQSFGKSYPIYAGNHTKIKDEFGSTEYLDLDKSYCEITRKRLIYNNSELFPAKFNLKVW